MKEQTWLEEGWIFHNHAWHLLHDFIKLIPSDTDRLLDYGAGTGIAAAVIRAVYPSINPSVLDIEKSSQEFWQKRGLSGSTIKGNEIPFPDKTFDVVMSSHVIEHIEDPAKAISEMFRVTKKRLIIAVPDGDCHFYDHKIIFGRTLLKSVIYEALAGETFLYNSFPVYHSHINNLIAVIDRV